MSLFTKVPSSTDIPAQFPQRAHPHPPPDSNGDKPVHTNKFYANMLLEKRNMFTYPMPYSVWWTGSDPQSGFCGLGISHEDASRRIFGPDPHADPVKYFFSPTGVMSLCLSAHWGDRPSFSTSGWGPLSVKATLRQNNAEVGFPICNGMGFVTGIYRGIAPLISSQVTFTSVSKPHQVRRGLTRVNATLGNNSTWSIYIMSPSGASATVTQNDSQHLTVNSTESGLVVQVAKLGGDVNQWQAIVDSAAGAYPTDVSLDGGVTNDFRTAAYALHYHMAGNSSGRGTLLYAAPHHVDSFTSTMNGRVTNLYLDSPVLGRLRLCVATELEMFERLPVDIGFLPWYQGKPIGDKNFSHRNFTGGDIQLLVNTATSEVNNIDLTSATNLDSMYFSGKVMSKYANVLLVLAYIAHESTLAKQVLNRMKAAFNTFVQNKQQTALFYDKSWKGLVSQRGVSDAMADFGNTYYNDHHFHYGYFIHSAAIIGKVDQDLGDGSWAKDNKNRDWVNALVRDVAAFGDDKSYPQSRMFDWYSGHSLAKGLFVSADGKDEESSSEDYNCWYGMKLWGHVTGDKAMESRGNLILAIEARAMNHYILYTSDNKTQPKQYIKNFVSGIIFENKIEHTTYFGTNHEYIQGIHMIPTTPISSYIRSPKFVKEEWEAVISHLVDKVDDGWKGILQLNRATYDPNAAYKFFSSHDFQSKWLDNGQSRTWGLAFSRALC